MQYDNELPIVQRREEIAELLLHNQVVVVCGETGSGKSTQLPKICLETGRGKNGLIGHTQPRRIAARSVAARIAEELNTNIGDTVGYKVRFDEKLSANTVIKLMTDGILLAESQNDRLFKQYDTLIIDEAHERSLNIDFLLGMFKRILPQRPDLKLIITSATIDAQRFSQHFTVPQINRRQPVPVIEVSGRTYPIEIRYRSIEEYDDADDVSRETDAEMNALLAAVNELTQHGSGGILIFLPTERDILETAKALRTDKKTDVLPLYARLPATQQQKVFQRPKGQRIILATNVAESSLTVPGIRYVIDTGTARMSRYSPRTRTQRLPIEAVSQASADQRAGRCGRVGAGICIRLYSELDYQHRERYTTPEIQRTNLASVILQTLSLKLGSIETFPFLDPPKASSISDGFKTLFEIGAIDDRQRLTDVGRRLSRLPVDPRIGRMILAAEENGVLNEMLIIASALEVQDPRERPQAFQGKADAAHAPFLDERSDYLSYLKLWDFYLHLKESTSRSGLRKACQQNFLSFNRMKEWNDVYLQLKRELKIIDTGELERNENKENGKRGGLVPHDDEQFYEAVHRSILAGNVSGIAQRDVKTAEYNVCNGGKFVLWPGSGICKKRKVKKENGKTNSSDLQDNSPFILAGERVETSRKYLRTVAVIDESWIEPAAAHLLKRIYLEPHWNRQTGYVHAYEKVSLFGIVIVPKRRINYGPIDPKAARDIFIQSALVEGELDTTLPFFVHNQQILAEAGKLQDKLREHDLLKPEAQRYQFYQERIPGEVYDKRSAEKYAKNNSTQSWEMTLEDVCERVNKAGVTIIPSGSALSQSFPDKLETFDLEYRYAPGEAEDGLTLVVEQTALPKLEPAKLGWLVPGMLEQKMTALLKSLPKDIRRCLVPIPDTVRTLMKTMVFGEGGLEERLCREVTKLAGRIVVRSQFNTAQIPPELLMNVRVVNDAGETLGEGKDFTLLRKQFRIAAEATDAAIIPSASSEYAGFHVKHHREIRRQIQHLPNVERLRIYAQPLTDFKFDDDVGLLLAALACKTSIPSAVQDAVKILPPLLESYHEARRTLEKYSAVSHSFGDSAYADAKENMSRLTSAGFLVTTPWVWLKEYPRYFQAVTLRFEKIQKTNDQQWTAELQRYRQKYEQYRELHNAAGIDDPELETFRWMIEEYRVSLFAQRLGTVLKVSAQRLDKQFEKVKH
ncbi:MAG: ATP-dependent RNA helicase HrpA [Planctomycetaceae bacterium]|jgi:ATP-dependent helicase HrpA|nr:ATP-dependent RNA helicase HrpA [Planctomycetaceae bacterium]